MIPRSTDPAVIQAERQVLRVLCQGATEGSVMESARRILGDYPWHEALHRAVFKALSELSTGDARRVRELLPSRLARMGFPDVPWEELFKPQPCTKEEAERLMRALGEAK